MAVPINSVVNDKALSAKEDAPLIATDDAGNKSLDVKVFQKVLPEAVKNGVDKAFQLADINKDGVISGAEAMAAVYKASSLVPPLVS